MENMLHYSIAPGTHFLQTRDQPDSGTALFHFFNMQLQKETDHHLKLKGIICFTFNNRSSAEKKPDTPTSLMMILKT